MDCAGLIFDDSKHYLDHLAPFCSLMGWPLIIHEPEIVEAARKYYPHLSIRKTDLSYLPSILVSCDPYPLLRATFGLKLHSIKTLFWLPHGHSDKGWKFPIFDVLDQEIPLVYGQKMADLLQQKNPIRIGNFRYHYFLKHRAFYKNLVPKDPYFLYAPTWDDLEKNSSFWKVFPKIAAEVSPLVVKIHPNTYRKFAPKLEVLCGKYPQVRFLFDFPPIYPLLEKASAYLGDMSSIGYDFLHYNRPMFFFPQKKLDLPLFRCGQIGFSPSDQQEFALQRKALYSETFDPIENWETVAQQITARL